MPHSKLHPCRFRSLSLPLPPSLALPLSGLGGHKAQEAAVRRAQVRSLHSDNHQPNPPKPGLLRRRLSLSLYIYTSLSLSIYIHIYVYIHTYVYVFINTCIYTYICICTCTPCAHKAQEAAVRRAQVRTTNLCKGYRSPNPCKRLIPARDCWVWGLGLRTGPTIGS